MYNPQASFRNFLAPVAPEDFMAFLGHHDPASVRIAPPLCPLAEPAPPLPHTLEAVRPVEPGSGRRSKLAS